MRKMAKDEEMAKTLGMDSVSIWKIKVVDIEAASLISIR
jgi:hypothetical protein